MLKPLLQYTLKLKKCILFCLFLTMASFISHSQDRVVKGTVNDEADYPIPGVNIVIQGSTIGTVSDINGEWSLNVPADQQILVFSYIGYASQEIAIGDRTEIAVQLFPDAEQLQEIVVIGYGQIEKKDATGAMASVKAEDFNQGFIASPEQLIQGRAAGVQITNSSGEPGSGVNVRIRGNSSVRAGNNPLFVVDGVPLAGDDVTSGGSDASFGTSSARNPLNFLNPNDIASIDILKDASATAIYGSRGANGVVMITTKSGGKGKGSLSYSFNIGMSNITKKYDLMNGPEFLAAYKKINNLTNSVADEQNLRQVNQEYNTDWQDEVLRTAISQQHNLSFGGGDEKGNYRFSVSYFDQEGIIKNSDLQKYTARFNGSKKFINDKLTVSTQLTLANTIDNSVPFSNNAGYRGDIWGAAILSNPTFPVMSTDTAKQGQYNQPGTDRLNPVAMLNLSKDITNTLRMLGNVSAELEIVKGLSFKTVMGFDRSLSARKYAFSSDLVASGIQGKGRAYFNDIEINNSLWENYFTYSLSTDNLNFNAVLGYSYQSFDRATKNTELMNFRTADLDQMLNNVQSANQQDGKNSVVNSTKNRDEIQSFFGRVNFEILGKYLITATVRADGSTKFSTENSYGIFPSFALKWRVAEENFLINGPFTNLDVRVGYGITGNQEIPHNLYQERQNYTRWDLDENGNTGQNGGDGGLTTVAFANPSLKWESTTQINGGIDFGLFDGKLTGSFDYYYKTTTDMLVKLSSAQPAPQPFLWRNLDAEIVNTGYELTLVAKAIDTGDFSWDITGNFAYNTNTVRNFKGLINAGQIHGQGLSGAFSERIANNQPLLAFFVREFDKFDENGIATYVAGNEEQKFTGHIPFPTTTVGLTNTFRYKGIDFSFYLNGQFGHSIYNNTANAYFTAGALGAGRNTTRDVIASGESRANSPDTSTKFLEDGSFVRLQNLTLGYNFDFNSNVVSGLRIYFTAQNLLTITSYTGQDPEVDSNKFNPNQTNPSAPDAYPSAGIDYTPYPRARTFMFGLNISF